MLSQDQHPCTVAPETKSGPGVSSNMMKFQLCEVQNRENASVWSDKSCDLKKKFFFRSKWLGDLKKQKKVFTEIVTVFPVEIKWSPKKKKKVFRLHMLISQFHFIGPPFKLAEANGLPEACGSSKVHGPWGHCPPLPPSWRRNLASADRPVFSPNF